MSTDNPPLVAGLPGERVRYDPGPSGTAVAGLIIGLIALAVALYAAFAPREVVRQGAQAVMTPLERAGQPPANSGAGQPAAPAARGGAAPSDGADGSRLRERAAQEMRQDFQALRQEVAQLRNRIEHPAPPASPPARAAGHAGK